MSPSSLRKRKVFKKKKKKSGGLKFKRIINRKQNKGAAKYSITKI